MRPAVDTIVIGGSAGALDALLVVLPALPADFGAAVVLVLHTVSTGPNLIVRLLAEVCALPVHDGEDKVGLRPGTIYVAPPGYHLLIERGGTLALSLDEPVHFSRPSIDVLFCSAADALGPRLAGLLLSGANHDGADGLAAIHRAGGLAVVQDPATASSPTMPQAGLDRVGAAARSVEVAAMVPLLLDLADARMGVHLL